jgi:hypothetical protein
MLKLNLRVLVAGVGLVTLRVRVPLVGCLSLVSWLATRGVSVVVVAMAESSP